MPAISIVIPAYNAERTIVETLESVQKQTFLDFEIIVINDGSTDQTLEAIKTVEDPRICVFSYSNGGLPVARNRGISQANGEFIAFLDADDLWTADKLELQLAALQQNPNAGVAYSWTCNMDENGENFHAGHHTTFEGDVYRDLLVDDFLANGSNVLVRRTAIDSVGEFDPTLAASEDWDYWLRLAAKWHFVVVPKEQIFYRQSRSSMTAKVEVMLKDSLLVLERAFQSAPPELRILKNQGFAGIYFYCAEIYLRRNSQFEDVKKAANSFLQAIWLHPQILKNKRTGQLIIWLTKKWLIWIIKKYLPIYFFKRQLSSFKVKN